MPGDALRAFNRREDELLAAGDVEGAVELNVATLLGPAADATAKEQVRRMQRRAFDVQLAETEEFAQVKAVVDLSLISVPCLAVSGGHDLPDFGEIAAALAVRLAGARHVELPQAGHLPSRERPDEVTTC